MRFVLQKSTFSLFLIIFTKCCAYSVPQYAQSYDKPTDYSFSYGVKDPHTGDFKHQWEKKEGDSIKGQYSLVEADGSIRTVDYVASGKTGFNAVVKKSPLHHITYKQKDAISYNNVELSPNTSPESYQLAGEDDYEEQGGYVYLSPEEISNGALGQASQRVVQKQRVDPVQEEYETLQYMSSKIPVDLNILQQDNSEMIVPLEIESIKPIEIQVKKQKPVASQKSSIKNTPIKPNQELSQEDLNKFLAEYYAMNDQPKVVMETGFKPITAPTVSQPIIPNTFKSNKKPQTTPGLKTYSSNSNNKYRLVRGKNQGNSNVAIHRGAVQNPRIRYSRRIIYDEED
ncbi:hypothetical protein ABEB36_008052 [Hypothenemus hampei]|uniref:Uncharacterized protein n=1 Tax=Hypothenemus hampei TaxID=57062 RepID=A0ABD1EKJ4_HYPHA